MVRNYIKIPIENQKKRGPKTDNKMPSLEIKEQILNRITLQVPKKVISDQFKVSLYIINKIIDQYRQQVDIDINDAN